MIKRFFGILFCIMLISLTVTGCSKNESQNSEIGKISKEGMLGENNTAEIALITDIGTIDDNSYNKGIWDGVVRHAKESKITYKYYRQSEKSNLSSVSTIEESIKNGAKVVICPGFLSEVSVFKLQSKYKNIKFLIIDGVPHDFDKSPYIAPNTSSICFAEEQAGYLAGYAVVKEGFTKLGVMGGLDIPPVRKYGFGFLQGADDAAKELNLTKESVRVLYNYLGDFIPNESFQKKAENWYDEGTQVIFACAGGAGKSVMNAAENKKKYVVGVDIDQYKESDTIITSAMKNLENATYTALKDLYEGNFQGGKAIVLGVESNNVLISMDNARFKKFDKKQYDEVYEKLKNNTIVVKKDENGSSPEKLNLKNIKLEYIR